MEIGPPPPSQAFDYGQDEDDTAPAMPPPTVMNTASGQAAGGTLLLALDHPSGAYLSALFCNGDEKPAGELTVSAKAEGRVEPVTHTTTMAQIGPHVLGTCTGILPSRCAMQWAEELLALKPAQVIVLKEAPLRNFISPEYLSEDILLRGVSSGLPLAAPQLEPPNYLAGAAAAVVSACHFARVPVASYVAFRGLAHQARALDARDFVAIDALFAVDGGAHCGILPAPAPASTRQQRLSAFCQQERRRPQDTLLYL